MTLFVVPLAPAPSQSVTTSLGAQRVRLSVYHNATGLFVDVYSNDALVIGGVIARNLNKIIRSAYLGFAGDLFFYDTTGLDDPIYSGLGSRFFLLYTSE